MPPIRLEYNANPKDKVASPCGACPIRHMSVCAALNDQELARLADISQTVRVPAGELIFSEGEPANSLFNVTSGTVKLYKLLADGRRQITGFLFSGDFLGLAVDDRFAYSAEAVIETYLCRFQRSKLNTLLEDYPHFQRRLFSMASSDLAVAQDQMLLLGRKSAKEKIASFMLNLSERAVRRGQKANPVGVPMSRADMGDYLGLTTETVSRTFTHLKGANLIRLIEGNKIELIDTDGLQDLADGG